MKRLWSWVIMLLLAWLFLTYIMLSCVTVQVQTGGQVDKEVKKETDLNTEIEN